MKSKINYAFPSDQLFASTDIDQNEETTLLLRNSNISLLEMEATNVNHQENENNIFGLIFKKIKLLKNEKNIITNIRITIIFIIVLIITILILLNPEQSINYHSYTVSKYFSPYINETIAKHSAVVRIRLRGPILLSTLSKHSNMTVTITNLECVEKIKENNSFSLSECQKIWIVGISNNKHDSETYITNYISIDPRFPEGTLKIELTTHSKWPISIGLNYIFLTYSVHLQIAFSAVILIGVYVLIVFDLVHRTIAAILGSLTAIAVLSTLNLRPSLSMIISWLDFETLNLLFGMMLIVGIFSETGFFDWIAFKAFRIAHGNPWVLLFLLCTFSAVISAFLDNVTTVLLMTPVSIRLCEALKMDPKKVLIAEVLFSNIGGTATAIGDPPNVILVSAKELKENGVNFANFTLHMMIGSIFIFFCALLFLRLLYRDLTTTIGDEDFYRIIELKREIELWRRSALSITIACQEEATVRALLLEKVAQLEHELGIQKHVRRPSAHFRETLKAMENKYCIKNKWLLVKCSLVLGVVILSFFLSSLVPGFHLDLGWISFFGAIWIIVLSDFAHLEVILDKVEWATLIFFAALFALMRALEELNLIAWIGSQISSLILLVPAENRLLVSIILLLWVSAIVSSFIDNIPFTTAMVPVILELNKNLDILPLVWAVAFGACLGGNGTLIGASANVVVAGIAQQHGYSFSFMDFFKVGFPMMILTTFIAMIYLIICHILIKWNYN